jgi:hypothetical protein
MRFPREPCASAPDINGGAVAGNVAVRGNNVGAVTHCRQAPDALDVADEIDSIARMANNVQAKSEPSRYCFLEPPGAGKTSILKHAQKSLQAKNRLCGYSEASPDAATAIDEFIADARRALPRSGIGEKQPGAIPDVDTSLYHLRNKGIIAIDGYPAEIPPGFYPEQHRSWTLAQELDTESSSSMRTPSADSRA